MSVEYRRNEAAVVWFLVLALGLALPAACRAQQRDRARRTPPEDMRSDEHLLDMSQWFPIEARYDDFQPSPIDQRGALDAPAGRHGFVQNVNGRWEFEDGTPARLFGVGLNDAPPPKEKAEYMARWMAKYGINVVRTDHLVTWPGDYRVSLVDWSGPGPTRLHEENLDRLDYFIAKLAEHGIYTRLSVFWYRRLKEADGIERFEEAARWQAEHRPDDDDTPDTTPVMNSMGVQFFDRDVMRANIDLQTAILTHRNPYRNNMMYGEDPAICLIEVTNEDSMFFYTIDSVPPNYQRELDKLWGEWLLAKYGSRDALAEAWGDDLGDEEDPADGTVRRASIGEMEDVPEGRVPRVSDQLRLYYELTNGCFVETRRALREAGVRQPICGTGWTGAGVGYWAEIYSNVPGMDYTDRHQYWGGGHGWRVLPYRRLRAETELTRPEILLKLGMERVMDMPFGVSEWNNALPNQWRLASAPLMALYGQALGGWDTPIQYCQDWGYWAGDFGFVRQLLAAFPVNDPCILCQYPALSLMLRRGDVQEGEPAFVRNLSDEDVFGARPLPDVAVKFETTGIYEVAAERGLNPRSLAAIYAGAVGKTGVRFTEEDQPDLSIELNRFIDMEKREIRSTTGELYWDYDTGYVTVDTPRAQGAIGFLAGVPVELGDCAISTDNRIASVLVVSWDGAPLSESRHVVITAVGRARNTGMTYSEDGDYVLEMGEGPVMLEGVRGTASLRRTGACTVTALDAYGYPTGRVAARVEDGAIVIPLDGRHGAAYYSVELEG